MSPRAHFWIRFVALVVIAAMSYLPRADHSQDAPPAVEVARQ
jgi:hypothetical protein